MDLSLGRVIRLLDALGAPQNHLPPVIHVAGTNGKGSSIAFMRAMLEAAGKSVHVYTSPHLVRFHERIRLGRKGGGRLVGDSELAAVLKLCENVNAGAPITFFEITTAAALKLFSEHPADVLLLEVGLGGRLDATNVVERPLATLITPVSIDHSEFLGSTIAEIAAEKAGILKPGVAAIMSAQPADALAVMERRAGAIGAPLRVAGRDFFAREEHGRLLFEDERGLLDLPLPRLVGRHQHQNAAAAIATLRAAEPHIPTAAIELGIATARWPARLQRLQRGRVLAPAPEGAEIWLDGAHNEEGA
ncbi:MAG: Mur ligase family protein, partial [Methylovirgula sp.]